MGIAAREEKAVRIHLVALEEGVGESVPRCRAESEDTVRQALPVKKVGQESVLSVRYQEEYSTYAESAT